MPVTVRTCRWLAALAYAFLHPLCPRRRPQPPTDTCTHAATAARVAIARHPIPPAATATHGHFASTPLPSTHCTHPPRPLGALCVLPPPS
ncbi:hypothetical protein K439DRAFT_1636195 [Ramaria rubella]|nr:hypothetical protein K439DRAFT_1636195 [Ramaria rubella]